MANKIQIELEVDDKGTRKVKQFGETLEDSTEKGSKGFSKLKKKIGDTAIMLAKLGAAAGVAAVGFVATQSIKQFADFEAALANVSTLVDTSEVSMGKFKDGIMALPPELGSATELTKGLYQTLSAGVEPVKALDFVTRAAKAAKAGLTDTFTAVDAGTTIINAFGKELSETENVFDQMFMTVKEGKTTFPELASSIGKLAPIAASAKVSTDEMFASIATLTKGGFKTSEAIARMSTALGTIVSPSKQASDMAKELELNFSAQALEAKGLHGFLLDVKDATGGNIEKMAQLFGGMESLSVMLALTGSQSEEFTRILGSMGEASGITEEAFQKQIATLTAVWDTFKNIVGKQAILIGEKLAPQLKVVIEQAGKWLDANRALITGGIEVLIKVLGGLMTVLGPPVKIIAIMAKGIYNLGTIIGETTAKIVILSEKIAGFAGKWGGKAIDFVMNFLGKGSSIKPLSEKISEIDKDVKKFVGDTEKAAPELLIDLEQKKMKAGLKETEKGFADLERALTDEFIDPAFLALDRFMTDWGGSWQGAARDVEDAGINSGQAITEFIGGTKNQIDEFGNYWNSFWAGLHAPKLMPNFDGNIIDKYYDSSSYTDSSSYDYYDTSSTTYNMYGDTYEGDYYESYHTGGLVRHAGGIIPRAHGGMFIGPKLRSDERHIIALTGEGVVNRQGMADIGGEPTLNAINRGDVAAQSAERGAQSVNLTINANVITTDDVDSWLAERMLRLNRHRVGGGYEEADLETVGIDLD